MKIRSTRPSGPRHSPRDRGPSCLQCLDLVSTLCSRETGANTLLMWPPYVRLTARHSISQTPQFISKRLDYPHADTTGHWVSALRKPYSKKCTDTNKHFPFLSVYKSIVIINVQTKCGKKFSVIPCPQKRHNNILYCIWFQPHWSILNDPFPYTADLSHVKCAFTRIPFSSAEFYFSTFTEL